MIGRYGMDNLSQFLGWLSFILIVIEMFSRKAVLTYITLILIVILYYRTFSRNISKRYAENQKYLAFTTKARAYLSSRKRYLLELKTHHIYKCPSCRQKIRIPRGKGRIEISCPKCHTKFIKNS
ncbi:MAG: hypothetical protein K5770_15740 [Lachnospiraceae bacterium]|nr:hypothetical protein [Lachnospiraceae bacterium]